MNKYLYRIFKKIIAIMIALILISADTLEYVYASVGQYKQETINQNVSSQEKIDDNLQASDDTNKEEAEKDKTQKTNTENSQTNTQIEEVNQELVVNVGQLQDMSNRNISISTGEAVRIHVRSTGSNANIVGDYLIRMEIDNPDVILSNFQKSDGTIQDEITLDGIKLQLVTDKSGKRYIITKLTQGSTHQFDFDIVFKNGVTNNGEKVTIKTDILDSNGNVLTDKVMNNDSKIDDLIITANASFSWDDVSKIVDKESVNRDNLANIKDDSIVYNIKAISNNKGNVGKIFTKEYTIVDELQLPDSISIPNGDIKSSNGVLTVDGKKIIEVSEKNAQISVDGKTIKIIYTKKNSNITENEIEEPNLQVTLYTSNLVAHKSDQNEQIINKASFEAKPLVGYTKEISEDIVATIVPAIAPNIKAKKSSTVVGKKGSDVEVGDIIKYEITVENDGSAESGDFVIQDEIPQNTEIINTDKWTKEYTLENNTIKWKVSNLEAGASKNYIFYVKVTNCDSDTLIKNTAIVNNKNTNETINKVVKPLPDISLHKYANDKNKVFKDGEIITYTIEVSNNGEGDSEEQTIVDTMPAGLVPVYNTETNTIESGDFIGTVTYNESNKSYVITWDIGCIKRGGSKITLTYKAKVTTKNISEELIDGEEKTINLTNIATNNDGIKAESTVKVGVEGHKINVKKQAECLEVREGQSVAYTLEFSNTGTKSVTANVIDVLPTNKWGKPLTWWSIDGDNVTITTSGDLDSYNLKLENGELIWEDVELEIGQKFKQTVILTFPYYDDFNSQFNFNGSKSIVNRLRVNGKQSSTFQIPKDVNLNINKSVDKDFIKIGSTEEVTFTIDDFSNISDKRLKNVTVTDDFSTENGLNSKFNVKEITTGSYEGVASYKVILKFKDNTSTTLNIDTPQEILNLSSMINDKNMADLKSMTFDFGDLQTDFKVVNPITVVATLKDSNDIDVGSITNVAEMYFNKAKVSDDATIEVRDDKNQNNVWMQKGIKSIGKYTKSTDKTMNGTYIPNTKSLYSYDSENNAIVYTYVIYNDINSIDNLPLKKAVDILPNGFKYITMSNTSTSLKNVKISNKITTVNDTTDINISPEVILDKGIQVNADYDNNNKVVFTFNEGAELQPGHAIVFTYLCEIDNENAGFSSKNKIAFLYDTEDKDAPGNDVNSKFSTNIDTDVQNDGTCNILDKNYNSAYGDEGYTWYESDVTVKKASIFPGISKRLDGFYNTGSNVLHKVNEDSKIGIKSSLKWTIKVSNNGDEHSSIDMINYTVIDTLPHPYTLSNNIKYTQNIIIYNKDGKQKDSFDISDVLEKSTTTDLNGNEVEVLKWVLADEKYAIPSGGYAEITFVSANDTNTANYGQYVNNATLIPTQSFIKDKVKEGNVSSIEIDGDKIDIIENQETANIFGNYSTYSFKQISDLSGYDEVLEEDKSGNGYGDNRANAYGNKHDDNTVNSSGSGEKIGYTLYIKSNSQKDLYNLTLIDKLPHIGDVGTVNLNSSRNSGFDIYLANNLNFKVDILDSNKNYEYSVDQNMYSIGYSSKTSYSNDDWSSNTTWDTSYDKNTHKSLRVTFNDKFSLQTGKIIRIYFEAYIGDNAIPGKTAWNSFGYQYSTKNIFDKEVTLIAEPAKVGVSIPESVDSAQISVTKVDEDKTNQILQGAEFGVYLDKECTNLITKITTTSKGDDLSSKLLLNTYYVKEIKAPEGYIIDDTVYTVNLTKNDTVVKVQKDSTGYITNKKDKTKQIKVQISKKDIVTNEELPGATLQIIEKSTGKIIEEWISTDKPYEIDTLAPGEYTLVEKLAPEGYLIAEPIDFTVNVTSEIQKVEMFDAKDVSLYVKKDVSNVDKLNGDEEFIIKVSGKFADGTTEKYIKFAYDELGEEKSVTDVIYGNEYKISEPQHEGYTVKIDKESVILMESKELVTVINTLNIPDIPEYPDTPDNPDEPEKPENPDDTEKPEEPWQPGNPDDIEKPEEPEKPENPGDTEKPEEPEQPENPDDAEKPEGPGEPDNPDDIEKPEEPEQPGNPEDTEKPEEPEQPNNPDDIEQPEEPEQPNIPEDTEKPDQPNNSGNGDDVQTGDNSLINEIMIGTTALMALVILLINDKRRKNS